MRHRLLGFAIAAMVLTAAATAQALPDDAAGISEAVWVRVQFQVAQSAREKHISERALGAVCAKMGVALARGRRLDLVQQLAALDDRAADINAEEQRLAALVAEDDPATANIIQQARGAIDAAGDLDLAGRFLDEAETLKRCEFPAQDRCAMSVA